MFNCHDKDKDRIIDGYIFKLEIRMHVSFFFFFIAKQIFLKARYSNSSKIVGTRTRVSRFNRISKEKFRFYLFNLLKTPRKIAENLFVRKNTRN